MRTSRSNHQAEGACTLMKTNASTPPTPNVDDMMKELALGLRDTVQAIPIAAFERDLDQAFLDLACRLTYRLRKTLTVAPIPDRKEHERVAQAEAAARIFNIFTKWMKKHPNRSFTVRISPSSKFQVVVSTSGITELFFGESVQDACAQAAQTIDFEKEAP